MLKHVLPISLVVGLAAAILTNCGGNNSTTSTTTPTGGLVGLISDAPLCDAISVQVTLQDVDLKAVGTGAITHFIQTTPSFAPAIKVNLQSLRDQPSVLYVNTVKEGTYDKATVQIQFFQIATYDPTQDPPVKILNGDLGGNTAPEVAINPPLVVESGKVSALRFEFDVARSLVLDNQGQITGAVNPVIHATPVNPIESGQLAQLPNLVGFVRSVSTAKTTSNANYIGSFQLQLLSASTSGAPAVAVNFTQDPGTTVIPPQTLPEIVTNNFAEVSGYLDQGGNLVGQTVEFEDHEDPINNRIALSGPIVSLTKDVSGNVTQFSQWVKDEQPADEFGIPLDTIVQVNLSPSTTYQVSALANNFANLPFGTTSFAMGQEVTVHGPYTKPTTTTTPPEPTTVAAEKVFLRDQAFQGSLGALLQVGSDNRTGAFSLAPCCTLLKSAPVYVLTNNETVFVNVTGLSALTPQGSLLIRGVPFFQPAAATINGISVPAGTLVMLARQVHVL